MKSLIHLTIKQRAYFIIRMDLYIKDYFLKANIMEKETGKTSEGIHILAFGKIIEDREKENQLQKMGILMMENGLKMKNQDKEKKLDQMVNFLKDCF